MPVAVIRDYSVNGDTLELNLAFSDEAAELKTYNIWVNDVPVFGMRGKELTGHNAAFTDQVTLNPGESKVEISCLNSLGNESFRRFVL